MLYAQLLGASWDRLADPVRALHANERTRAHGRFRITNGANLLTRTLARALNLPRPNDAADIRLVIAADGRKQHWRRTFDGLQLDARQYPAAAALLAERIRNLELRFRLEEVDGSLLYRQVEVAVMIGAGRYRLPSWLAPSVDAREDAAGPRRVDVHVRVRLAAAGTILTYDGAVTVEDEHA